MIPKEIEITHCEVYWRETDGSGDVKVFIEASVNNLSSGLIDDLSLRAWVEGKNLLGEDIQLVLVEHLFLPPYLKKRAVLSGTIFNPQRDNSGSYPYSVKLELIDANSKILQTLILNS